MPITASQRVSPQSPCQICGGHPNLKQGTGSRCWGYLSSSGRTANCTREELAGPLRQDPKTGAYPHHLYGACPCGKEHNPSTISDNGHKRQTRREIEKTYDYRNSSGQLLFQVVRYQPKGFAQRRPDGHGGWHWNLNGIEPILYRLPELLEADPTQPVLVPEGEDDVNRLKGLSLVTTCNPMGAGKWRDSYTQHLVGRQVVVLPDNDDPGRDHAEQVATSLHKAGIACKLLALPDLPERGDVSDWLDDGHSAIDLLDLAKEAPEWEPTAEDAPETGDTSPAWNPASLITPQEQEIASSLNTWPTRFVSYASKRTDAPAEFLEAGAIACLSVNVGRKPRLTLATGPVICTVWVGINIDD